MRIELASLEGGKARVSHQYAEGELVLEDPRVRLVSAPSIVANVSAIGSSIRVSGQVVAQVEVECDRCLKPIQIPIDSAFRVEYVSTEEYRQQQDAELTEEDMDLAIFDGEAIDIDDLVAEEVLLAVPDHRVCSEDCKGICPGCGADRNNVSCACETGDVDPRWSALKKLVNGQS